MSNPVSTLVGNAARGNLPMTVAVTSLGFAVVQLDGSILNVALSQIGISLRTGINDLQWTVDAYFVAFAVLLLSAGSLSDRWGARRAFVSGFCVFSAASLACGVAPNVAALIAARAVQGAGAALLVPCSLALLNGACVNNAPLRARAVGLWTAAGGVGIAVGPILGGLLIQFFGWRSIFFINLPIGITGIWLTLSFLNQPVPARRRGLDLTGQTLIAFALLGLVGAIIETGSSGWRSTIVLFSIGLAITAGVGFIAVERRVSEPAIPSDLFQSMNVSTAMLVGFTVNSVMFGVTFAFALYFQRILLFSTIETGIAFLPFALMVTAANVVGGQCAARFGLRVPMVVGLLVAAVGCVLLLGIDRDTSYLAILPGQLLIRLGIGLTVPTITTAILAAVPSAQSGIASGTLNAVRQTGGAVGVAVFGALMATDVVHGVQIALVMSGLLLFFTAAISFMGAQVSQERDKGSAGLVAQALPSSVQSRSEVQRSL
jgi:DHA2 family methylenomycin A resistance protein-like MFS transporter